MSPYFDALWFACAGGAIAWFSFGIGVCAAVWLAHEREQAIDLDEDEQGSGVA